MSTTLLDRFWSKVDVRDPGECWEWRGSRHAKGYGQFNGARAHRFSYQIVRRISYRGAA